MNQRSVLTISLCEAFLALGADEKGSDAMSDHPTGQF
jgi:hypothetical protein